MNYNELVKKMDDIRCAIQKGESYEYEGGVQQLLYNGECAITALAREVESAQASRKRCEELVEEYRRDYNLEKQKAETLEEANARFGRIIDHFLDEE